MLLRVALAAVAVAVLTAGCGGDSRREDVAAYIEDVNAVQQRLLVQFTAARRVYTELSRGEAKLADVRPRLTKAAQTMETIERELERLMPPPDAMRLHRRVLEYMRAQITLAHEVESVAEFAPEFEERLGPLGAADRRLRTALAASSRGSSQATAIARYGQDVGAVLSALQTLEAPAPMAAAFRAQVETLTSVRRAAKALAEALREENADALPARILDLAKAARTSQSLAAQKANIAALKLYNERIARLARLADSVTLERARLERTLR